MYRSQSSMTRVAMSRVTGAIQAAELCPWVTINPSTPVLLGTNCRPSTVGAALALWDRLLTRYIREIERAAR